VIANTLAASLAGSNAKKMTHTLDAMRGRTSMARLGVTFTAKREEAERAKSLA